MNFRKLAAVSAALVVTAGVAAAQTIQINRENKTIAISTTDEASSLADIAAVTVGFMVYGPDAETAYADGGKRSHAILEALHNAGIEDKNIESKSQALARNTVFDDKETAAGRAKKQFQVQQSWQLSIDPRNAARVIHVAIAAGANQTGEIDWRLADRKALQAQAAANALVKARAVASQMADGLHVKLGTLIYASNETPNAQLLGRPGEGMVAPAPPVVDKKKKPGPPLEILPQTIREEATVYAVFTIE